MKKTLYPRTTRIKEQDIIITEKLDGSNLGIFNLGGELIIAQRNNIFKQSELTKENSYKGLRQFLENTEINLCEGSGIFGEWIGMGKLKYGETDIDKRFYIFAKANINENFEIRNLNYNTELFKYPFENQEIPKEIGIVPIVQNLEDNGINISDLNLLYESYKKEKGRSVEGFIINNNNNILKYVRHKNGKETEHKN